MRIAICNMDTYFSKNLKRIIYRYADYHRMEMVVDCFNSGENILVSKDKYNLVFLDYELAGMNGLEIAEELRKITNKTSIVFISDRTEFVFDAFKVNTFRFLPKTDDEGEIFPLLDDFFAHFGNNYPLWIKSGEDIVCLNTGDIYYLEADNKRCYIHLKEERLICNRTMAKVYNVLPKNTFSKTNRAFVVNLKHISRYNSELIVMENGDVIYPSRNYYKTFKEEYRNFLNPYEI